ncbi:hypothetical protein SteCoe_6537 [Stentor coeruleus]|uniref:Cation efflux protein cytoplasmic domain-containing protein n=1 Tax=Stentor coeruleus TaxID=5963 RepID=A0A1R2CPN1_9CILI|nr:hypothetical protein SteCoe_6537 [Stentor coeruleus]
MNAHDHENKKNLRKLYISVFICILFMTGEVIGGIISGSLAILTDAAHILSDILGFCISIVSMHISQRPATKKMSYGFYRAEVIGALLSIALIWALTTWLFSEAIHRLIHKSSVEGSVMLITAMAGLLGNLIMGFVIGHSHSHSHSHEHDHIDCDSHNHLNNQDHLIKPIINLKEKDVGKTEMLPFEIDSTTCAKGNEKKNILKHNHSKSLNMRAAFLHVIGDALQSIGVIIAGIVIYFYPEYSEADPICTLLFSVIVMFTTMPIIKDCVKVLMEGTPNDINASEIKNKLLNIEGVLEVHEFHIWSLSASKTCMSCHLVAIDPHSSLEKAIFLLKKDYGILNTAIQIELQGEKQTLCCDPSFL